MNIKRFTFYPKPIVAFLYNIMNITVPDHDGGRRKLINAWFLNTHMVYL